MNTKAALTCAALLLTIGPVVSAATQHGSAAGSPFGHRIERNRPPAHPYEHERT